jgi:hypothetical protein
MEVGVKFVASGHRQLKSDMRVRERAAPPGAQTQAVCEAQEVDPELDSSENNDVVVTATPNPHWTYSTLVWLAGLGSLGALGYLMGRLAVAAGVALVVALIVWGNRILDETIEL